MRLFVIRSVSAELLTVLRLLDRSSDVVVELILASINACEESPNLGLFGVANDQASAELLRSFGVTGVEFDMPPAEAIMVGESDMFDELAQASCALALPELFEHSAAFMEGRAVDVARGVCLALLERRHLRAARTARWLALLQGDADLYRFRDDALGRLQQFVSTYQEIGYHLAVTRATLGVGISRSENSRVSRSVAHR